MTYVVLENCAGCKHTDCADVCPVEAFHESKSMLYINPEVCIDCNACLDECPVDAIRHEGDLSAIEKKWITINRKMSKRLPVISMKKI